MPTVARTAHLLDPGPARRVFEGADFKTRAELDAEQAERLEAQLDGWASKVGRRRIGGFIHRAEQLPFGRLHQAEAIFEEGA